MSWWEDDAILAQRQKRQDEQDRAEVFTEDEANRAAAYTRDDLSKVVSYLSSLNSQVSTIKNIMLFYFFSTFIALLLALVLFVIRVAGANY
ncbi:MAG: hypothetical protein EXR07_00795 [Acetobacteraceae bacterium]|nr:hypothetical protein [Acetobacteraceae bacterium]